MACNYAVIRRDWYIVANSLPPIERLQFYEACLRYEFDNIEPAEVAESVRIMFALVKPLIDEDKRKSEKITLRNRLNGQKGGRPCKNIPPADDCSEFQIYFYFFSAGVNDWRAVSRQFINHYSARGWRVAGSDIIDRVALAKSWKCDRLADISESRSRYCELLAGLKTTDIRMLQDYVCIECLDNCCVISLLSEYCVEIIEKNAPIVKTWLKPNEMLSYKIITK